MTTTITIPHPPIVSRDQWLTERKKLLVHDRAQLRVQELGATNPGEYLIYRHESADQISISAGRTRGPVRPTASLLVRAVPVLSYSVRT
jgi:hypothetical protein